MWGWGFRQRRGPGQWEVRTRSGDITPPASGHRLHSVAECGRAKDARAPLPALTLCAPAAEHHPGRGVSTGARSTACCLSTACGAATCQVPFPLPTCTCGPLGIVHFFPPHHLITIITFHQNHILSLQFKLFRKHVKVIEGPRKPLQCRWLPSLAVTAQRPEEGSQRPDKLLELQPPPPHFARGE